MMKDIGPLPILSDEYKQPYPILFYAKHTKATIAMEGDVQEAMDKVIGRNVYRIRGAISAKNYVTWQDMDIAGPTLFIQAFLPEPYISTMHFEVCTKNNQSLRISISTLYNGDEPKFLGRSLRLPFPIHPGWFVMAIDFDSIIKCYCTPAASNDGYTLKSIKKIQACSNIILREVVSAPLGYFDGGKILPKELNVKPQSKPFDFFVIDGNYPWSTILPASATVFAPVPTSKFKPELVSPVRKAAPPIPAPPPIVIESPVEKEIKPVEVTAVKTTPESPQTSVLPPPAPAATTASISLEEEPKTKDSTQDEAKNAAPASLASESQDQQKYSSRQSKEVNTFDTPSIKRIDTVPSSDNVQSSSSQQARCDLSLKRVIGYGCGPAVLLYGSNLLLCGVGSTLVMVDLTSGNPSGNFPQQTGLWRAFPDRQPGEAKYAQSFLRGHRNKIGLIEVSVNEKYMITAETEVKNGQIYLWNLLNGSRVATMAPFDGYIVTVGFSPSETQLVTVGTDSKGRHKILIWQIATLLQANITLNGNVDHPSILAKQLSDFSISKIIFDPLSENALVTCGRENIRLWRTKKQHLSGRPILLNEYCRGFIYHDLALVRDATTGSFLYAASSKGIVLKICYQTEQILSAFQLHSESINTFQAFNGYAVTGGDDCRLRIWPMDFGDFLLEARHEGGVKIVNGGKQGRKLVIGTKAGTLGLLDVTQHSYETILRSHVGPMVEIATRSGWNEIATISTDRTTRVWNVDTGVQTVEFASDFDIPTAVTYHHSAHALFCGYHSGVIRMFDVVRAATIAEINVHHGNSVVVVKSFVLDGIDVLLSIDTSGEMYLINCETKATIASFSTNISTAVPGTPAASNKFLCVELFGENRFVSICSGGGGGSISNTNNSAEKASPSVSSANNTGNAVCAAGSGEDLVIVYLSSMTIAYSEKNTTVKKSTPSLLNSDEVIYAMGYTSISSSSTTMNMLTFVTSKRVVSVPMEITDYPQCVLDRSAIVAKKHDSKGLKSAYFNAARTTVALIASAAANASVSSTIVLSTPSSASHAPLSSNDDERSFSIIQLRLEQTQTRERMVISNPIRQRLAGGDICYFSFLKEQLAATSDRFGCLTIWKVTSNNLSFVDSSKDERMVATPSVPSCSHVDQSVTKDGESTPLIFSNRNISNVNASIEAVNTPMKGLFLHGEEEHLLSDNHEDPSILEGKVAHEDESHMVAESEASLSVSEHVLDVSDQESQNHHSNDHIDEHHKDLEDDSADQPSQLLAESLNREELKLDMSAVTSSSSNRKPIKTSTVVLSSHYKGFLKSMNHPNSVSKYVAWCEKNCICLVDAHSQDDEYLELFCCPEAKIHATQLFNSDNMVVAMFSTPQQTHHLAVWCKQATNSVSTDFKFSLVAITDSFLTGKLSSTAPVLLYALSADSFLIAYASVGTDSCMCYHVVSVGSSPGIVGRVTLPPINDYKAMDIRVVNPSGAVLLLSTQGFVCVLSLGFGYRSDKILWIDEVKPADLILASYGCFLSTPSNGGRCEYIHINLCKSAKLRVHLIEQTYSTDMRVEVLQPTIRTALTPLPTIDNFTTSNPKGFELLFNAVNESSGNVSKVNNSKLHAIKGHVYLRMAATLRVFQLSYSPINQVALKASMNSLAKKTLKATPEFMDITAGSSSPSIVTFANASTVWTIDGHIIRQSLADIPRRNLLIPRICNTDVDKFTSIKLLQQLNIMTMGLSCASTYNISSQTKVHEMNFEDNTTVATHALSANRLWLALGFTNDFVELYDTATFKRWYRFSTKILSASPCMKIWFVSEEVDTTPGLLMLAFEHQTLAVQFSAVDGHVQHRCVASVPTLKSIQCLNMLHVDEPTTVNQTEDIDEDDSDYEPPHVSTIDTRLADFLHRFEYFYNCANTLNGKEGRYEHWDKIFAYEVKRYKLVKATSSEDVPSSSRRQEDDDEARLLMIGNIIKDTENTTTLYMGVWAHGVQERSVTIIIPKDELLHFIQRFGAIVLVITNKRMVFINQEDLLGSATSLTTSASVNSLSSSSPLDLQDCCTLSIPMQNQFQEIVGAELVGDWLVWSYVTQYGNVITSTQRIPRTL